jgi:hypothetical protein
MSSFCFQSCTSLENVIFESDSKVHELQKSAFLCCSSLKSICIPASVEIICKCCFRLCTSLDRVSFEPNSKLLEIEKDAFSSCPLLNYISIPGFIEITRESCFRFNRHFEHCFVHLSEQSLKQFRQLLED